MEIEKSIIRENKSVFYTISDKPIDFARLFPGEPFCTKEAVYIKLPYFEDEDMISNNALDIIKPEYGYDYFDPNTLVHRITKLVIKNLEE